MQRAVAARENIFRRNGTRKKKKKKKKDALIGHWMRVVNSWDEEGYRRAWEDFRAEYALEVYSDLIEYVEEEWLSVRLSFVKAFTKHVRHFEQNTTSKAEAAHSAIKRSLNHSQGNMFETVRENAASAVSSVWVHQLRGSAHSPGKRLQ